jgi:glycosyltransferase involved in cell wall biosynthesis
MPDRIWVTWEKQRRNYSMSIQLGAKLIELDLHLSRWLRYPVLIIKTLVVFIKERPAITFVQNPSLLLTFLAVTYGRVFKVPTIVDAHNAGLYPLEGSSLLLNRLASFLLRWSDLTIVTNRVLAEYVTSLGGRAFIMPDPMPEVASKVASPQLRAGFNILFVCSWAEDEPYLDVMRAAKLLDNDVSIYITGNSRNREKGLSEGLSSNVELTGFVSEVEYLALLNACDAVMVLTSRDDCMLCGAYEAVAAGKPLVLSGSEVLRHYFDSGCVYTTNDIDDVARAIASLKENYQALQKDIRHLHEVKLKENERLLSELEDLLVNQQ